MIQGKIKINVRRTILIKDASNVLLIIHDYQAQHLYINALCIFDLESL